MIGQQFRCVCCGEPHDEDSAKFDESLRGPVCLHCHFLLITAAVRLHKAGITRILAVSDINHFNYNRFKGYS